MHQDPGAARLRPSPRESYAGTCHLSRQSPPVLLLVALPRVADAPFKRRIAHEVGAGVLHYDRDYDLIAEHTSLSVDSVWLAPAGTL